MVSAPEAGRPFIPIPVVRRGLGKVFLISGMVHALLMAYASCLAAGLVRWRPGSIDWFDLCALHLFATAGMGAGYIAKKDADTDILTSQLVSDLIVGLAVFACSFVVVVWLLARWLPTGASWVSLATSGWLIYYGFTLFRGRQVWSRLDM